VQLRVAHDAVAEVSWSSSDDQVTAAHANALGAWELACPTDAELREVARRLTVVGDRTAATDAASEVRAAIGAELPPAASPDELTDRLATALGRELTDARAVELATGLGVPPPGRDALIELYGDLGDRHLGAVYAVSYASDATGGWVVAQAERQDVCRRGLADANTCA
jgi:hypothetical protein